MNPFCTSTLIWENKQQQNKRNLSREEENTKSKSSPQRALKKRQRQSLWGKGGFGVVLFNGQVRISTFIFILCLIEATLWTSCLLSSHSALKTDTLEAEHYLLRETENLKNFDSDSCLSGGQIPQYEQSYLLKQHIHIERLWAHRIRSLWSNIHLNWNTPLLEHFQGEASVLDKGVPGPFAGVKAID